LVKDKENNYSELYITLKNSRLVLLAKCKEVDRKKIFIKEFNKLSKALFLKKFRDNKK